VNNRILFFGELPAESIHGISIANSINIEMLESKYFVDKIVEHNKFNFHDRFSVRKVFVSILDFVKIASLGIKRRYKYFYLVFSLSSFGCLKTLLAIIVYKIFSRGEVILHIHRGDFFLRFYKGIFNIIFAKIIFKLSDKVIVLSDSQVIEFEKIFKRKFVSLPNTITCEIMPEIRSVGNRNFIYISNYLTDKGIYDLLEVFKSVTNEGDGVSLKCFGAYPDLNSKEVLKAFASNRIMINGPIVESVKFEELKNADCLILPSWNEGQPVIILEAMSLKTPIIASDVGLIPEMLGQNYPFLTKPRDNNDLKEKILKFIKYNNKEDISDDLYNRYYKFYSRDIHYKKLLTIFSES